MGTTAPRRLVELLQPSVGLPLRAWKNYPRLHGLYAPARTLCRLVPRDRDAVDVGANRGVYAYWIARRARHVYAFEPLPGPSDYLRRAKVANITVIDAALSDTKGRAMLRVPAIDGEASLESHLTAEQATPLPVATARLDDYGLTDVGFMKIDVEGHELQVLRGADDTIRTSRPTLLIEVEQRFHPDPIESVFDHIIGSLSYAFGYAWQRGRLVALADFRVERDQVAKAGDPAGYVNNFVFADAPLS